MLKIMLSIIFTFFILSLIKTIWRGLRGEEVATTRGKSINYNRRNPSCNSTSNLTAAGAAGIIASEFYDTTISNDIKFHETSVTNDVDEITEYSGLEIEINPSTGLPMIDNSIDVAGNPYGFDDSSMSIHADSLATNNDIADFNSYEDSFSRFDGF
jgi:hypothetical protein